jgi:hypothetical protein
MGMPETSSRTKSRLLAWLVALTCGACGGSGSKADAGGGAGGNADAGGTDGHLTGSFGAPAKLDLLFVIDDWASTDSQQQKLLLQLTTFVAVLRALPGGLPDLHAAVISADMGGCAGAAGDDGVFKSSQQGSCVQTTLAAGATFVTDDATGATKNFTLADPMGLPTVLECIGLLGSGGCGFGQPLRAAARALGADGQPAPTQNAGFLREDAELAIVLLTNQDDCSIPDGSDLFSDTSSKVSDPLGPLSQYRCNEFGHLCGGLVPPRMSPDPSDLSTVVALDGCVSNEAGRLTAVGSFVAGIEALKPLPGAIVVAAITGPTTPYNVTWSAPPAGADTQPWPSIESSCVAMGGDGTFGQPSVRTAQFVEAFGADGVLGSICDASYANSVTSIAGRIGARAVGCVFGNVAQFSDGGSQCTLTEHGAGGARVVPSCLTSGAVAPCWTLDSDPASCGPSGARFLISGAADAGTAAPSYTYDCLPCTAAVANGCP